MLDYKFNVIEELLDKTINKLKDSGYLELISREYDVPLNQVRDIALQIINTKRMNIEE